jgi:heme-degrading monooxygenase HmoA
MAVTLLNVFMVPTEKEAEFLENWKKTTEAFKKRTGFIETHLHRNTGVGNQTFQFINVAKWESAEAWRANHDDYQPTEYFVEGVKGHPAIFEAIVHVYAEHGCASRSANWTW